MATFSRAAPGTRLRAPQGSARPAESRRAFLDNPRLILLGISLLLGALVALVGIANRWAALSPDFLSEVVLHALSVAVLTLLVVLIFVLARNIIKLVVERRRALPFARFRAKLVATMLAMTLVPAVLVLIVGSELIATSVDRWFSAPIDEVLVSANRIASDYYREREMAVGDRAARLARSLGRLDLGAADLTAVRGVIAPEVTERRLGLVEIYRVVAAPGGRREVLPVVDVAATSLPHSYVRASADRLAARVATENADARTIEPIGHGGDLVRAAAIVRDAAQRPVGVVVATAHLTGDLARQARRITEAYEGYSQLRVLRRPLAGVYLSFFAMVTLMILVGATWMGVYLAKRITRPIHRLADAAREIGAGHFDHRVERETSDEFGSLVDAFNTMAGEVAASQEKLERSRLDLEGKSVEAEGRRRYIETILERIATGVVSIDANGRISTINAAAARLLGLDNRVVGRPVADVLARPDLQPLAPLAAGAARPAGDRPAQEVALAREGREVHLAAATTPLQGDDGSPDGAVLVLDDVTPLIRAQRVAAWRDVARRLAHEIKNPLTPIQLCAERLRRHFTAAPPRARALVDECTATIVGEVESLKGLVDEFSQFARMPAPRTVPSDLHELLGGALVLYDGLFGNLQIERSFADDVPPVRVDPEQIRRVIINLVDNAVEALVATRDPASGNGQKGVIRVQTEHDPPNSVVRITVADNGPGIAPADRDKLFMPYFSTKRRGSGLGLAIVRRIVVEHGGNIEVGDNLPQGTRFTVELPC